MIDTNKTTLMDKSSPLTSPEKVVAQQTKDLINISSRLVISETSVKDEINRHNSPELPSPKTDIHTDAAARQSTGGGEVDTKKDPSPYPVPAPRSIKPALPTKPEGLVKTDTASKLNGGSAGAGGLYPNLK